MQKISKIIDPQTGELKQIIIEEQPDPIDPVEEVNKSLFGLKLCKG